MRFSVDNVSAGYATGSRVVQNLSLEVDAGETLCLLGRNGVGKTTLLKAIMGIAPFTEGAVSLDDERISELPVERMAYAGVGYVPQGRRLFHELTVQENLAIGAYARHGRRVDYERVFELFPKLEQRLSQVSGTLSGGEQQMLAMARAFCLNLKVLLLDEPSEGLMPSMVCAIAEFVQKLTATGVSVIMVEQRLDTVRRVANRIALMEGGTIVKVLSAEEIPSNRETIRHTLSV